MSNPYESTVLTTDEEALGIRSLRTTSLVLMLLNLVITILVIAGLLRAEQFEHLLTDFEIDTPLICTIMFSPWTIGVVVVLAIASVAKEFLLKSGRSALIFNAIQLPLLLVIWQLHTKAIWLPFVILLETLR